MRRAVKDLEKLVAPQAAELALTVCPLAGSTGR